MCAVTQNSLGLVAPDCCWLDDAVGCLHLLLLRRRLFRRQCLLLLLLLLLLLVVVVVVELVTLGVLL
jgi:hypothetical protein